MPRKDYQPTKDDFGWWFDDTVEAPRATLARDLHVISDLQDDTPEFFTARPAKEAEPVVLQQVKELMSERGYERGSMDLMLLSEVLFGELMDFPRQIIGSCVASGAMRALATRILWETVVLGDPEEWLGFNFVGQDNIAPFGPYHYGCGRRRGNMRGGDGSYCGAQIEGLQKDGFLPCDTLGLNDIVGRSAGDYPEPQNSRLYRDFGNWKHLDKFIDEARKFDLLESERITDVDREYEAFDEFKPMMVCSGWGFKPDYKHKDGFWVYKRSGSWSHNMTKAGKRIASDRQGFTKIWNSWGSSAHRDGAFFYIPQELDARWLRNSVVMTIGDLQLRKSKPPTI